ncbi:uncharacterized protein LOC141632427 [Silene latifolia]|uniref:uncharacterized protein LOC141632427 n=1 Tax=Silene latifolia TaxID=37657 RepID=UPI003D77880F
MAYDVSLIGLISRIYIEDRVWSKIDRALANPSWLAKFPATSANFLPPGISDHSPILVTIFEDKHEAWMEQVNGSLMFKPFAKLKNVQNKLLLMHKESFTDISSRIKTCKDNLHLCQQQIQEDIHSSTLLDQERILLATYMKLKQAEGNILKQKEKIANISYNDLSSKYFYARIHDRKQ